MKYFFFHFVFIKFWRKQNFKECERFVSRNLVWWQTRRLLILSYGFRSAISWEFDENSFPKYYFARTQLHDIFYMHAHSNVGEIFPRQEIFSHIFGIWRILEPMAAWWQMGGVDWLIAEGTQVISERRKNRKLGKNWLEVKELRKGRRGVSWAETRVSFTFHCERDRRADLLLSRVIKSSNIHDTR